MQDERQQENSATPSTTSTAVAPEPEAADSSSQAGAKYDPAFREAVAAGFLTARQAFERGDRRHYAAKIASRHELSEATALEVADNRISLAEALVKERPQPAAPIFVTTPRPRSRASGGGVLMIGLLGLLGLGVMIARSLDGKSEPQPAAAPSAEGNTRWYGETPTIQVASSLRRDEQGRPTEVFAATPKDVLEAFCGALGNGVRAMQVEPSGSIWAGRYILADGTPRTITIDRDAARGGWRVGDGEAPIQDSGAP